MKKMLATLALVMLLCMLPVWAMAETLHVNGRMEFSTKALWDARDEEGMVYIQVDTPDSTIVLNNVVLPDTSLTIEESDGNSSVRIELIGDNFISTKATDGVALWSMIPLTITGEGSLTCTSDFFAVACFASLSLQSGKLTAEGAMGGIMLDENDYHTLVFSFLGDELTVKGSDPFGGILSATPDGELTNSFTLPEYSSAPAGYTFKAWSVTKGENSPEMMQPGDPVNTAGGARVSVKPVFEKIPELPTTGDDSNVILWSALAAMSIAGMAILIRKKKTA